MKIISAYLGVVFLFCFLFLGCMSKVRQIADNIDVNLEGVNPKLDSLDQGMNIVNSVIGVITGKSDKKKEPLDIDVLVSIKNDNTFALDVAHMTYNLYVNGEAVGNGMIDEKTQSLRIESGEEKTVTLPVNVNVDSTFNQALSGLLKDDFHARVNGVVTVNTSMGKIPVPYSVGKRVKPSDYLHSK